MTLEMLRRNHNIDGKMDALEYERLIKAKKMIERNSSPMGKRNVLDKAIRNEDLHIIKYLAEEVGLDSIWIRPPSNEKEKIIGFLINRIMFGGDKTKQQQMFLYFLERGANPESPADDYRSQDYIVLPIEMAISYGRNDIVDILLDYGAFVRADAFRRIPDRPMILNDVRLLERLFQYSNQAEMNKALFEITKFTYFNYVGDSMKVAKLLIDYGVDKSFICNELTETVSSERAQILFETRTQLREYFPINPRQICMI